MRITLLLKNPSAIELISLNNLIWVGKSIVQQEVLVHAPKINVTSTDRVETLKVIRSLETKVNEKKLV
jgi:hypothetical protein